MSDKKQVTRRDFLAAAVTTAASSTLGASPTSTPHVRGANEAIRLGFVGLGVRGAELLCEALDRSDVRVVAVCDAYRPRLECIGNVSGARRESRWERVVERANIDAVVIAAPDHWHATMAMAAIESGKDVYCESPMSLTVAEAKAFRDKAAEAGAVVQIGAQETSEGQWHTARDAIASGRLGPVVWAQGNYVGQAKCFEKSALTCSPDELDWEAFLGPAPKRPFDPHRFFGWRRYWDYSSGIAGQRLYQKLAPLLLAVGPAFPRRVSAAGGIDVQDGREAPDAFVLTAEYPEGYTMVLASSVAGERDLTVVIHGRDAALYAEGRRVRIVREDDRDGEGSILNVEPRADHLSDWLDAIRSRRKPACNEDLGYAAMVAIGLGVRAYRERRTFRWDPEQQMAAIDTPSEPAIRA